MKKYLKILFALVFVLSFAYGLYFCAVKFWAVFKSIDPTLAAGMLAASATVFVSVLNLLMPN